MSGPKIVSLDIETAPALADVWSLWDQNVSLSQLRKASSVIAVGWKERGKSRVHYATDFHNGHDAMLDQAWKALNETDILLTYNGMSFDVPHLMREFVVADMPTPSPFKHVDLYRVVKRVFRFQSNKLQHVSEQLGLGGKVQHAGHSLWVKCMAGDPAAWGRMVKYMQQDVRLNEQVYDKILGYIPNHPKRGLWDDRPVCDNCGQFTLAKDGTRMVLTAVQTYQRYRCTNCGHYQQGKMILHRAVKPA